jgi:hypothetical protein
MTSQSTRLLDAQTVLVGWINHSATDCYEHTRSSGDVVNLGTDLDATSSFVLVASHPGHSAAVTVTLELAPLLPDGTAGSWITAAAVAIPAGLLWFGRRALQQLAEALCRALMCPSRSRNSTRGISSAAPG